MCVSTKILITKYKEKDIVYCIEKVIAIDKNLEHQKSIIS
jgi:hypothetical protein